MGFLNIFRSARTRVTCSPKSQNIFKPAFPAAYLINLSGSGGHCCGQPSGLLSFPNPPEEQEEDHGGGAAGRRRVQTVSFEPSPINPSDPDFQDVCVTPDAHILQPFKTCFYFSSKNKKKYQQIVAEKTAQAAGKNRRKRFHKKSKSKKQ